MKIRMDPHEIWKEYQKGISYNTGIDLYENVKRNNDFFNDKQWEGVNAPDLDKPVFNFLKPVVSYYVAMLISDDIAVNVELGRRARSTPINSMMPEVQTFGTDEDIPKIIAKEVDDIIERANMKYKNRRMVKNCAIDGDACFYIWFDPDAETGFDYKGDIRVDLVDSTNVLFGNPSEADAQEQPYILIAYRRLTEDVKDEVRANGLADEEIVADNDCIYTNSDRDSNNDYTTVVLKMWKEKGTVRFLKCTEKAMVKNATDTEYKLYPLVWMSWESEKNCYHGVSPLTGKIQNQIFVNKIYAMAMMQAQNFAFPKVLYDQARIPKWNNRIGQAVGVSGDPNTAIFSGFRAPDMSADAMNMVQSTITQTKDMMGASDAALGNVSPDNTSAIIAVQKASSMPLDIQRMDFYNFVESCVRIFIEMMRVNYGTRQVTLEDGVGGEFDFSTLENYALNLKIDIGQGSYWSELMQVQTLDALMANKIIPDALTYLEAVPDGYIKNKNKIMERIQEQQNMAGMMQMPQDVPPVAGADGMAMQEMPQTEVLPEAPPESAEVSQDDVAAIIEELSGMETEEAAAVLAEMDLPDALKEQIATMMGGTDGQQM